MPASMNRLVDLPHPDGPSSATNSPSSITRLRSGITSTSPKRLTTFSNSIRAIAASAFHAADRHLHEVALRGGVEDEARHEIEDANRGDDPVVDPHHVVAHVVHVETHRPVRVPDEERENEDVFLPAADEGEDGDGEDSVPDLRQHDP